MPLESLKLNTHVIPINFLFDNFGCNLNTVLYQKLTDQQLWQRCREDDMGAYGELFDRFMPLLFRFAQKSIRDSSVAEELAMDVMVNLWQRRHYDTVIQDIEAYLYRSIRNSIVSQFRKMLPVHTTVDAIRDELLVYGGDADHDLLAQEADSFYQQTLSELSPQRLLVYKMSREENKTYAEIAQETNLSINTVKRYLNVTLDILRKSVREYSASSIIILLAPHLF